MCDSVGCFVFTHSSGSSVIFPIISVVMGVILTSVVIGGRHQRTPCWNRCHSAAVKLLDENLQEQTQPLPALYLFFKNII